MWIIHQNFWTYKYSTLPSVDFEKDCKLCSKQ